MRILIIGDDNSPEIQGQLQGLGYEADFSREVVSKADSQGYSLIVLDWDCSLVDARVTEDMVRGTSCAVLVLANTGDGGRFAQALASEADAVLALPYGVEQLRSTLLAAVRTGAIRGELATSTVNCRREAAVVRELTTREFRRHDAALCGESREAAHLRAEISRLAKTDDAVQLVGPAGAGQEAVAMAIHEASPRANKAFVRVACARLEDSRRLDFDCASTDQQASMPWLSEGGTLYLEGYESLGPAGQARLLTYLREAALTRASGEEPNPDVRLIASRIHTYDAGGEDHGLRKLERQLSQHRLQIPSLQERSSDVSAIAEQVLTRYRSAAGKAIGELSDEAHAMLESYDWPGNVSELENVIERAVLLSKGGAVDVPSYLLQSGRRVGGYALQRKLGEGSMGEVWLAEHALLSRPSAVKLIRRQALQAQDGARQKLKSRFSREAQATSKLRSPHTVELYDFGSTADGDFYYVMEYLQGIDLDGLVRARGALDAARAVFLLTQACMSLEEAHAAGLVHRDVKPANFFVCQLGTHFDFIKLLDFGIVRGEEALYQTWGGESGIRGTPETMSPEATRGEPATSASDIYGLGCVAYWLLTGQRVFEGDSVVSMMMQHANATPTSILELRPRVPKELNEIVLKCLAKNPGERPESAAKLRAALATVVFADPWNNERAEAWWRKNFASEDENDAFASVKLIDGAGAEHVDDDELARWMKGHLSIKRAEDVEKHLETCDWCAEKLGELEQSQAAPDEFVDRMRNAFGDEPAS